VWARRRRYGEHQRHDLVLEFFFHFDERKVAKNNIERYCKEVKRLEKALLASATA
jgi:hypothetical protein